MVGDISKDLMPYTRKILQLLAFSERPLSSTELVNALAIDLTQQPYFDPRNRMPNPREITKFCPGLISIIERLDQPYDNATATRDNATPFDVQLAHFSVKEWLVSRDVHREIADSISVGQAQSDIAKICAAYLLHVVYDASSEDGKGLSAGSKLEAHAQNDASTSDKIRDKLCELYPFAEYSSHFWAVHAASAELQRVTGAFDLTMELLSDTKAFHLISTIMIDRSLQDHMFEITRGLEEVKFSSATTLEKISPLDYASYWGLFKATKTLIEDRVVISDSNPEGTVIKSLTLVCARGHTEIAQLFLSPEHRAKVAKKLSKLGKIPLQKAAESKHEAIVRLLIKENVEYNTVLDTAITRKDIKVLEMFTSIGIEVTVEKRKEIDFVLGRETIRSHKVEHFDTFLLFKDDDANPAAIISVPSGASAPPELRTGSLTMGARQISW